MKPDIGHAMVRIQTVGSNIPSYYEILPDQMGKGRLEREKLVVDDRFRRK